MIEPVQVALVANFLLHLLVPEDSARELVNKLEEFLVPALCEHGLHRT